MNELQDKLFDLINKHSSWEEFIEMLPDKLLIDFIEQMEEYNNAIEDDYE